ncbi:MAG: CheR family methyltransferase, partial [Caldilineaceae bacterium]
MTKESVPQPSGALSPHRFPIVGVVGTAGSRQALRLFFRNLPEDSGMAFIVVTRLASRHIQTLPGLLQEQTDMPIVIASDNLPLQPDHVYICPAGKHLLVEEGRICLEAVAEAQSGEGTNGPLDTLLLSLAKSNGEDAIAILLSGTGTDGVAGLVRTRAAGGLVMIQDPDEAAHPALPRRAMAACPNCLVATAGDMVRQLVQIRGDLADQPAAFKPDSSEPVDALYAAVLQQMVRHTGHDLSHYKVSTLQRRIASRMGLTGVPSLTRYVDLLKNSAEEANALFRSSLVSVTSFFRDPDAHEMLGNDCIPQLFFEKKRHDVVRVWVAGCATGQEAYSIAMHLAEYAAQMGEPPRLQVFATDLDEEAIAIARRGVYPKTIAKEMSPGRLERFFTAQEDGYQVKAEIREHVLFAVHDLFKDPPFSRIDLISCRNVLIYFNRAAQARLLEIFHYALNPQPDIVRAKSAAARKYLFLGTSESVDAAPELFSALDKQCHLYLRNEVEMTLQRRLPTTLLPTASERMADRVRQNKTPATRTIEELYTNWSLRVHLPPRLLVNNNYEMTHLFGAVDPYLHYPAGPVTQNVLQRIRPELLLDLRSALYQAFNKREHTFTRVLRLEDKDATHLVRLHVGPITEPDFPEGYAEVLFVAETEGESEEFANVEVVETDLVLVRRLEEELNRTRERLQRVIEEYDNSDQELKVANQELQSVNEELKSTTEELETSKEELQSMNEELITVNSDLLEK